MNFILDEDEVVLYEDSVNYIFNSKAISAKFTLTSKRMVFEKEKGVFKKQVELIDVIGLNEIKIYNEEVQCKPKFDKLEIQAKRYNFSIGFLDLFGAKKVYNLIVKTITGTNAAQRQSKKVKKGLDQADEIANDTIGVDARGIVRGILTKGIKGTIINGIDDKKDE